MRILEYSNPRIYRFLEKKKHVAQHRHLPLDIHLYFSIVGRTYPRTTKWFDFKIFSNVNICIGYIYVFFQLSNCICVFWGQTFQRPNLRGLICRTNIFQGPNLPHKGPNLLQKNHKGPKLPKTLFLSSNDILNWLTLIYSRVLSWFTSTVL